MFSENEKALTAATLHHRSLVTLEMPFDYEPPTLARYRRLTHDASRLPRIELSFALLHYEKALHEFNEVKAATQVGNTEITFFHGVYCVVAAAACIEAIANKLVFQETTAHPDHRDRRQPLQKINEAATALAQAAGVAFIPLAAGQPSYDALETVRQLRNAFMHAKERDEEVDPVALTSTALTRVDEPHRRTYLQHLRLGVVHIYGQLGSGSFVGLVTVFSSRRVAQGSDIMVRAHIAGAGCSKVQAKARGHLAIAQQRDTDK